MPVPKYDIFIHPTDLKELKSDIWIDEPVPAVFKNGKKRLEIDISYRGSHIRKFKKKSYHVTFYRPKIYGGAREIHLNSEYKDPSLIRNKISLNFFEDIGVLSPSSHHVQLSINGKYEGIYLQLESVDEYFLKRRSLPSGAVFYAIDDDANFSLISPIEHKTKKQLDSGYEVKYGNANDSLKLANFIFELNTTSRADYEAVISTHLNVEKYLRWLAGVVCTQNYDGFVHNYALYLNRETNLFEVVPWDYDATWGRDIHGEKMSYDYVRMEGFNTLTARLLDIPNVRNKYVSILSSILENQFTVDYMEPKVESLHNMLKPIVEQDPYIQHKIDTFHKEPEYIYQFIRMRNDYLLEKLRNFV